MFDNEAPFQFKIGEIRKRLEGDNANTKDLKNYEDVRRVYIKEKYVKTTVDKDLIELTIYGEDRMLTTLGKGKASKSNSKVNKAVKTSLDNKAVKTSLKNINRENNRRNHGNEDSNELKACSFCGSSDFIIDSVHSEVICRDCGAVLEENIIDITPSGTSINREGQNLTQNGGPCSITKHDMGLSTDFDLNRTPNKDIRLWTRLRRLNNQAKIHGSRERNLSRALGELSSLTSRMSLPNDVKKEAASVYRSALDKDLVRGRSIDLIIVASLYVACRRCRVPRTFDEFAEVSNLSSKKIARNYMFLSRELSLKLPLVSPADYIPRFSSDLNLSSSIEVKSLEIVEMASESGLIAGKTPKGVAAAALYWASILLGERRTQSEIASVVGVTEVTIRARYKELSKGLKL